MVSSGDVAAIHVAGVRCDPCGAMRCNAPNQTVSYSFLLLLPLRPTRLSHNPVLGNPQTYNLRVN